MKLEKAIELLKLTTSIRPLVHPTDEHNAILLSIEALKFRLDLEQTDPDITLEPLPGETPNGDSP